MDLKSYCLHQKELIERAKWLEGIKIGRDPGQEFVHRWIRENAEKYREEYQECFRQLVLKTANVCEEKLKKKVPGVSDELWKYVFQTVIEEYTKIWTAEIATAEDESKKRHLEEI